MLQKRGKQGVAGVLREKKIVIELHPGWKSIKGFGRLSIINSGYVKRKLDLEKEIEIDWNLFLSVITTKNE